MQSLVEILMERDELSRAEAIELIDETREAILEGFENGKDAEEIIADYLGLEPDYLFEII